MARPKKNIDYKLARKLSLIHCTQEEIANVLELSLRKLQNDAEFMRIYKKGISDAKMTLRRKQWQAVNKGHVGMMIWLGKQYLEQREPMNVELGLPDDYIALLKKEALNLMQSNI